MHKGGIQSYKPDFSLSGENKFAQIMRVIGMTPWAFIGFESISHSASNFGWNQYCHKYHQQIITYEKPTKKTPFLILPN